MVTVQIVTHPAFRVMGKRVWINEVEDFFHFWDKCHADGTVEKLKAAGVRPGPITGSDVLGVSRVEKDPENRTFFFYIVSEITESDPVPEEFEAFPIEAAQWAVFESDRAHEMDALYEAEMYAHGTWLSNSDFKHALAPELEVYPVEMKGKERVQFWLPVELRTEA